MSNVTPPVIDANQPPPKRTRLWLWFAAGFLVVFFGLAAAYPMHFYDGRSVRQTVLGHYYLLELQQEMNSTGNLGPTSGNLAAALTTALMHLVLSGAAGAIVMGIRWVSQKRSQAA
jgi:hypothetical protein